MRKNQFRAWLAGQPVNANTAAMRVRAVARIENAYGIDLDEAYNRDGLASVVEQFSYSTEDAARNKPNPTRMNISRGDIRSQVAWYRTQINSYRKFCEATGQGHSEPTSMEDEEPDFLAHDENHDDLVEVSDADELTFALEADLEAALRSELHQLEEGLVLADGGQQRKVGSGFIDILAKGADGTTVVIELKSGQTRPAAVAQILGYMSDIAEENGATVRGYLVGAAHHDRVIAAAKAVPHLSLRSYSYRFSFSE
ncbi:DUF91 domain-containing protein [Rhodobacteraceae bacterium W635]|uniref:endonuclease NucS domain-containing protein n=1 Tax=Nioella halotolerans TaxID=2303578 RepID=UPI000E3DD2B2|nr:DUF91 domain-containing protein [Rhodobacteraceae bacterium W635]